MNAGHCDGSELMQIRSTMLLGMLLRRRCNYLCKHALRPGSDTLYGDLAETLKFAFFLCMQDGTPHLTVLKSCKTRQDAWNEGKTLSSIS